MRRTLKTILIFLILINIFYVVSGVVHFPLRSIDAYSIWLYKAKAFFAENGDIIGVLKSMQYSHPQYPIFLPWIYYRIYRALGYVNEYYVLFLYPVLYAGVLFISYKFFRKIGLNKFTSLFFVYTYSMLGPLLAQAGRMHAGTADIVITLINWIIVLLAFKIVVEKKPDLTFLIVFLLVISSQIKLEGVFIASILLFLPLNRAKKVVLGLITILPTIFWYYIVNFYNISPDFGFFTPDLGELGARTSIVLAQTVKEMANIRNWYFFWLLFWTALFIRKGKNRFLRTTITPSLLFASFLFLVVYLLTGLDTKAYVSSSVDRVLLQLSPFFYSIFVERATSIFKTEKSLVLKVLKRHH